MSHTLDDSIESLAVSVKNICSTVDDLRADRADMLALLHDIREEIDGMIDIRDGEDGTPQPNWAMSLSSRIDEILEKAGAK